jgi:hypothetical protein
MTVLCLTCGGSGVIRDRSHPLDDDQGPYVWCCCPDCGVAVPDRVRAHVERDDTDLTREELEERLARGRPADIARANPADETPTEPRACDFDYHAPDVIIPDLREMRSVVADNAADLIEDLLARLAAAEANRSRAEADADRWERAYRFLALRERPNA